MPSFYPLSVRGRLEVAETDIYSGPSDPGPHFLRARLGWRQGRGRGPVVGVDRARHGAHEAHSVQRLRRLVDDVVLVPLEDVLPDEVHPTPAARSSQRLPSGARVSLR